MTTARRTAAFFDLDKTIIATSSSAAFSRDFMSRGLLTRADAVRTGYAQLLFMMGGADERQTNRLRDALSALVTGWDAAQVRAIVEETVRQRMDPVVYQEALTLMRRHQENGRDVVIISASGSDVVEPIAALLGADEALGSRMEVRDGRFTGTIDRYLYGPAKAEAIRELAAERGYDLQSSYAYSDSITDTPMLDAVGNAYAVNPDRAMRRAATEHGWGVLRFRRPVALRRARQRQGTAAGVAMALVVGVVVWSAIRRYRRLRDYQEGRGGDGRDRRA